MGKGADFDPVVCVIDKVALEGGFLGELYFPCQYHLTNAPYSSLF